MDFIEKVEVTRNVKELRVSANIRYWGDATLNGNEDNDGEIPCRIGDLWEPIIELETGKIMNWNQDVTASVHYKICDAGRYQLIEADGSIVKTIDGYVPIMLSPKENNFGDYIIMNIDENGVIDGFKADLSEFYEECE